MYWSFNMKVTIITPCLNSVKTISQTIESVLHQTYDDIEYIIIDGCSTDGTCEVIERYIDRLAFYSSEPDEGIYYAMNKGLKHATGEIVGIINSDDWYEKDTVENVVEAFKKYDCQMVHGRLGVLEGNKYSINEDRKLEDLYMGMTISHPTVFLKRSVYLEYGYFDEKYKSASDYELMLRLYSKGIKIEYIPSVLAYFRKGGYSQKYEKLTMDESFDISKHYIAESTKPDKECMLEKLYDNHWEYEKRYRIKKIINVSANMIGKEIESEFPEKIAIFGAGASGEVCYDLLNEISVDFEVWIDNNVLKQGNVLRGKPVISLKEAIGDSYYIIVASKDFEAEMLNQIKSMHVSEDRFCTLHDLENRILSYESVSDE